MPTESLRDQLEAAYEEHVTADVETTTTAPETVPGAEVVAPVETTTAEPQKSAAERARDDKGKFLPKDAAAEPGKPPTAKTSEKGALTTASAAAPAVQAKIPRPTSWKKELEAHWDQLPPEVQAYTLERERQYATGVSTYKTEADRAKHLMGAISEFEPALQKNNIDPAQWITNLGRAHYHLALGNQQQKVETAVKLIQSYGIDANALFQVMSGQQPTYQQSPQGQQQYQPVQHQFTPAEIDKRIQQTIESRLADEKASSAYEAFSQEVAAGKYPHLEEVKQTMGRLLETGFAKDYPSAYDTALRMPEHANLAQAAQQQQQADGEAARKQAEQQRVQRARSQAVSVRSSTPSAMTQTTGPKSLREQLSEEYDRVASGGRI